MTAKQNKGTRVWSWYRMIGQMYFPENFLLHPETLSSGLLLAWGGKSPARQRRKKGSDFRGIIKSEFSYKAAAHSRCSHFTSDMSASAPVTTVAAGGMVVVTHVIPAPQAAAPQNSPQENKIRRVRLVGLGVRDAIWSIHCNNLWQIYCREGAEYWCVGVCCPCRRCRLSWVWWSSCWGSSRFDVDIHWSFKAVLSSGELHVWVCFTAAWRHWAAAALQKQRQVCLNLVSCSSSQLDLWRWLLGHRWTALRSVNLHLQLRCPSGKWFTWTWFSPELQSSI